MQVYEDRRWCCFDCTVPGSLQGMPYLRYLSSKPCGVVGGTINVTSDLKESICATPALHESTCSATCSDAGCNLQEVLPFLGVNHAQQLSHQLRRVPPTPIEDLLQG
jgi:hypothetical protein